MFQLYLTLQNRCVTIGRLKSTVETKSYFPTGSLNKSGHVSPMELKCTKKQSDTWNIYNNENKPV